MAPSVLTTTLTLFAFVAVGSCLPIRADLNLFTSCTTSNTLQGGCEFNWHNASIWIGRVVPGPQDDVLINTNDKVFTLICNGLCTARQLNTTAQKITIRMSNSASMVLHTWTATDNVYIEGGALNATGVSVTSSQFATFLSLVQVQRSGIKTVSAHYFKADQTTIQMDSLTANETYFVGSRVTVAKELAVGLIKDAIDSHLYFLGTCKSNKAPGTRQTFQRNYLYSTTACLHPFSGAVLFEVSHWEIDANATAPSVYLLPDWITLDFERDSVVLMKAPFELHINTTVRLSNTLFGNPYDKAFVVVLDNGYLAGYRSFMPLTTLTALGGVLEINEAFVTWGVLRLGPKATVHFNRKPTTEQATYLSTSYLVLEQPTLNYFNARPGSFIKFTKGNLTGSFGTVNMNNLPYVLEYNNDQGYIAAVSSNSPAAPPVASPLAPPVASTPINAPVAAPVTTTPVTAPINAPVTTTPVTAPVAPPQVLTPMSTPQSQVPVTNAPVFDAPPVSEPHAQPVSESSPSNSNLSPTAVTELSNDRTLIIVLAVGLAAAVIGLIVLGALFYRAKRRGYQVIKDAGLYAPLTEQSN